MSLLGSIGRPEYLFRPRQVWRRLRNPWRSDLPPAPVVQLPWGYPLTIKPAEVIGRLIWTFGVFDLPLTEALWRLADPGDLALDVGANIGYTASLLAARVGAAGRLTVFEPFPEVRTELQRNVDLWKAAPECPDIRIEDCALADRAGQAAFEVPPPAVANRGLAKLAPAAGDASAQLRVRVERLDGVLSPSDFVGVLKIDVEGGELAVLRGAEALLKARRIRDLVFEDHDEYPTACTRLLEDFGYEVFSLRRDLFGAIVKPGREPAAPLLDGASPSFLATTDGVRLRRRFASRGWQVLVERPGIVGR